MSKQHYAIFSDSVASILLAAQLEARGHTVSIISSIDLETNLAPSLSGASNVYPTSTQLQSALAKLSTITTSSLIHDNFEAPPLTVVDGEIKPFMGFGDISSAAVPMLSKNNQTQLTEVSAALKELPRKLYETLQSKFLSYSELTSIEFANSRIEKVILNGSQDFTADAYVFMHSPAQLTQYLPPEYLGSKVRARIAKSTTWARVDIQFEHNAPLFDGKNSFFLVPNLADQSPCCGQFTFVHTDKGLRYFSVWSTYIDNQQSDDYEFTAGVIKNIKKLVRKAFPTLEEKPNEVISVTANAAADFDWLADSKELSQIADNLLISPTISAPYHDIMQCVLSAGSALSLCEDLNCQQSVATKNTSLLEGTL
jgi:hypothetical protein